MLDPCCGEGNLLVRAITGNPLASFVGSDIDSSQLLKARKVFKRSGRRKAAGRVDLFVADLKRFPALATSFDCIISDLPFGREHCTESVFGRVVEFVFF